LGVNGDSGERGNFVEEFLHQGSWEIIKY